MTKEMTRGSPVKLILSFMIPLLFGNIFQNLYSMVDAAIVEGAPGLVSFHITPKEQTTAS